MSMEGSGNNRRRGMSRPYTYVSEHPAQNEHFGIYGIYNVEGECNTPNTIYMAAVHLR